MELIRNVFVEKRLGFQQDAEALKNELNEMLGFNLSPRVLHLYQVRGLQDEQLNALKNTVFSDPQIDVVHEEPFSFLDEPHFLLELLPGQYDQRAEAVKECILLTLGLSDIEVRYKTLYVIPEATSEMLVEIKNYLLNPVEMREGMMEEKFTEFPEKPLLVETMKGFTKLDPGSLEEFQKEHQLAMTVDDLALIQTYFTEEKRDPSITELKVLDTYWSDHCRHTTFLTEIKNIRFSEEARKEKESFERYLEIKGILGRDHKPVTLMDLATVGARYLKKTGKVQDLDESEEINACSIERTVRTTDGLKEALIMFKNETHNHPTEIEPFGGAATCLGGAIRDPLSGRTYVYQGMRITGAADPRKTIAQTRKGKLPQRTITKGAAKGFSSYGNQIGLTTGFVEEIYHPGYEAKRMETGAVISANLKENVIRKTPVPGDLILLLGGKTGRDGIGGATGSSKEHDENSVEISGQEVQKGNAVEERKLQRLFRREDLTKCIKKSNDFGAGGVSVAIGELAPSLKIYLHRVPKKYQGLDPTEIAISESQERMAVVIRKEDLDFVQRICLEENVEATFVAEVTDTGYMEMYHGDQIVVRLKRSFLDTNGAHQETDVFVEAATSAEDAPADKLPSKETVFSMLQQLNNASQKGLLENFDTTIGRGTLLLPYGGLYQDTKSPGMAAVIPLKNLTTLDASLMTYGFDPEVTDRAPYEGAYEAVVESIAKIIAMGGDLTGIRLSFQEYFRKLGTDARNWGKPFSALLGALQAQLDFEVPAIGGKDSMSGSFEEIHVPNTLISFAVQTAEKEKILVNTMKGGKTSLLLLRTERNNGMYEKTSFKENAAFLKTLTEQGKIISVDTLKKGFFPTALNMALGNRVGMELTRIPSGWAEKDPGSFLLEVAYEDVCGILREGQDHSLLVVGKTTDSDGVKYGEAFIPYEEALTHLESPLKNVFPSFRKEGENLPAVFSHKTPDTYHGKLTEKPKVLIPVFFGTNCELDLEFAFRKEGAEVHSFVLPSGKDALENGLKTLADKIDSCQILMLAGGFSAADEPEGSGKYIANVLRSTPVKEAVERLINERDGLILGICNGFQGLVKSGLLPYGRIISPKEDMPILTYNTAGKHMSRLVKTKVVSRNTPWMQYCALGDVHDVPVSHGEGRFAATPEMLKTLLENGQIITQYVDLQHNITMEAPFNPNGSMYAIEGIASKDGRVFGKMGHTERYQDGLYKNYTGSYYEDFFKAGVDYFKK
ncbi:MAG TPA: phosphoribosylformylglycinamidine synthase [Proteiniclasticum sp.]|uniref:phosphoribosylformylglycinamidine synthase n=1 Tax=Proteiniclasticum sp. TaxID=2053595 RepID=UPI000E8E0388|nr:phosphoribosylformylglycinamidine synthase [Proteiniclasticum sp.]HBW14451.1 phosphoribosylformylglycinamidine synthase [Proteiniclasticum sp.]